MRNSVLDYMAQQKNTFTPSPSVFRAGSRFSSQTNDRLARDQAPISPSAGNVDGSETQPPSSFETLSPSSQQSDDGVPETESANDILSRMTLDNLLDSEGRDDMLMLVPPSGLDEDPKGGWFHLTHRVAGQIREIIEADFKGLYYNWTNTPKSVRESWFKAFAQYFNWKLIHTKIVEKKFNKQAAKQLRGLVADWKRRMKKPKWMGKTLWALFLQHWRTDKHLAISKRNSKARKTNKNGVGPHVHCMGQKSFIRRRHELRAQLGRFPSDIELLVDTHKRKSDGVIIDSRTIQILDEVNKKVDELRASQDGSDTVAPRDLTPEEINVLFREAVPPTKGGQYGMGSVSEYRSASNSFTPDPIVTTLQAQLQSTQAELKAAKEAMTQQKLDFEANMARMEAASAKMEETTEARFKAFEERFLARQ